METVANHPIPTFVHVLVVFLALAVRKLFSVRFFSHVKTTELASKNQMDILVNVKMVTMAIIVKMVNLFSFFFFFFGLFFVFCVLFYLTNSIRTMEISKRKQNKKKLLIIAMVLLLVKTEELAIL